MASSHHRGPGAPGLQAGRNQPDRRPAHAGAGQAAGGRPRRPRQPAALPLRPRAAVRGAGRRSTGGRAPSCCGSARRSCCTRPSARASAASTPRSSCRAAPSCSTPSAPRARPRSKVYRLALAVVRAAEAGASPELLGRYLEAWLLQAARALPAARPLRGLRRAAPGAGALRYHRAAHGFVCDACGAGLGSRAVASRRAALLGRLLHAAARRARATASRRRPREPSRPSTASLIGAHLERDLRAPRVIREITREGAR